MNQMISALCILFALSPLTHAKQVAGIEIPDHLAAEGVSLSLNGAGVRSKWMTSVYVGGLYLTQAAVDAANVLAADEPMAIKLHMVSGLVTSERMKTSLRDGFEAARDADGHRFVPQFEKFAAVFDDNIRQGDVFDLLYLPGKGIEIYKNSELKDSLTGGVELKRALFGIWLIGEQPQDPLKQAMLGG